MHVICSYVCICTLVLQYRRMAVADHCYYKSNQYCSVLAKNLPVPLFKIIFKYAVEITI